jgi:hypothetical protein
MRSSAVAPDGEVTLTTLTALARQKAAPSEPVATASDMKAASSRLTDANSDRLSFGNSASPHRYRFQHDPYRCNGRNHGRRRAGRSHSRARTQPSGAIRERCHRCARSAGRVLLAQVGEHAATQRRWSSSVFGQRLACPGSHLRGVEHLRLAASSVARSTLCPRPGARRAIGIRRQRRDDLTVRSRSA